MTDAVIDAGPLIHLAETGHLTLLELFDTLLVPDAVWFECTYPGRIQAQALLALNGIRRQGLSPTDVEQFIEQNNLSHLQAGEIECLVLCLQSDVRTLLTDDMAAREAAKRLGIRPVGSLGIVIRAYRQGIITLTEAESALADLFEISSLFVTRTVVEMALEQLHDKPE